MASDRDPAYDLIFYDFNPFTRRRARSRSRQLILFSLGVFSACDMFTIYRLQSDRREIRDVQKATQATDQWGLEPTHGLFGSSEWWQHIRDGTLPVHRLKGKISRVYMGSMNDWPEFAMLSDTGEESEWSRYANEPEFATFYTVGRPIEIDYVVQRTRGNPADFQKIPIQIRVDDKYA